MKTNLTFLTLSLAVLMTGCASNKGSFELDNVQAPPSKPVVTPPSYSDDTTDPRRTDLASTTTPALGFALEIPRRNTAPNPATGTKDDNLTVNISDEKIVAIHHQLDDLPKVFADKIENDSKFIDDNGIYYSHDKKSKWHTRDLAFVRSGYVIGEKRIEFVRKDGKMDIFPAGQYGYVFYQGVNPATSLPTTTATYKGTWDFVSNADGNRKTLPDGFSTDVMDYGVKGNGTGATSLDADINYGKGNDKAVGLTSELNVNFADKKFTGKLTQNHWVVDDNATQTTTDRYTLEGKLHGNRFSGTATTTDKDHPIFGKNSSTVEGGFFGENGEELAGKFVADEGSLFAVFAGKREAGGEVEQQFDASKIDTKTLTKSQLDTFGNVAYLVINGKQVPLLPTGKTNFGEMDFYHTLTHTIDGKEYQVNVCCNNLDYVKFGEYSGNGTGQFFLIGERTAVSKMPTTGKVHYRGTWDARIVSKAGGVWAGQPSNAESGARSRFDVDFGAKTLTGKLIAHDGTEDNPAFNITGTIAGNGFTGIAKTGANGFNIDTGSTTGGTRVNIEATVNGGFYGNNASEIGGTFHSTGDDKVGGVFGGKRQVKK